MDNKVKDINKESTEHKNIESPKSDKVRGEDPVYWRSFRELNNDPDFLTEKRNEFISQSFKDPEFQSSSKLSRRKFLALISASAAIGASGCTNFREKGEFIAYNKKPEEVILGIPNFYASTCSGCPNSCGILIRTLEGRPIKVDGNPDDPVNKGKICAMGQASIMNLYDPERIKNPSENINKSEIKELSWGEIDDKIISQLWSSSSGGKEIAIFASTINSPTQKKLLDDFKTAYPTTKVYSYELFNQSSRNSAWEKSYGSKTFPVVQWDKAKIILSLESDFLGTEGNTIEQARLFTENRDIFTNKEFNRLYSVEGNATVTGMNADYRIILRTDAIEEFVMCLMNELIVKQRVSNYSSDTGVASKLQKYSLDEFAARYNLSKNVLVHLVEDLKSNQGSSFITAGSMLPESTHIVVNLLNEALGNNKLYTQDQSFAEIFPLSSKSDLDALMSNIRSGGVGAMIHFDSNPVYLLPPDYGYSDLLKNVPLVITLTEQINESSALSNYTLPINTMFESWGDFQTRSTFYTLQQPVIAPLYNTRQKEEILLTWIRGNKDAYARDIYHKYLMDNWRTSILNMSANEPEFLKVWYAGLNDGVIAVRERQNTSAAPEQGKDTTSVKSIVTADAYKFKPESFAGNSVSLTPGNNYVLILSRSSAIGDGRYANNGWLQELPKPVSRVVWDNYAAISVQTSNNLNLKTNDKINLSTGAGSVEIPVFVQPGVAEGVIAVELGYGRSVCGVVGADVGFNANKLMSRNAPLTSWLYNDVKVEKASGVYELVSTQDHYSIEEPLYKNIQFKRGIIREGTYNEYKENPDFLKEREHKSAEEEKLKVGSINEHQIYKGVKWGMVIDLNKCVGCNDCVVACNVENNIPIIGKDQVKVSREMQWLRIDRYYSGTAEKPKANFQPMLCQHCDYAPCENVCPVAATTHSTDGINAMAYNRCVGTRYCSNNCPYKVRRFNYFNFRDRFKDGLQEKESLSLMQNPEVTVRSRGVMEKCTFCLQRIMEERQKAIQENRMVKGSNVKTACQEACGTDAIYFGDQNDVDSDFHKKNNSKLGYHVLEEIKVKPNITYIAKLRNVFEKENMEDSH